MCFPPRITHNIIIESTIIHNILQKRTMERKYLSIEQEHALQQFEAGENILVSGPAGTGKTSLIKQIIQSAVEHKWKIQICAMTGCAAILLGCNASTLHSWSGIRLAKGSFSDIWDGMQKNANTIKKWKSTRVLVVDEVSMMSKRIFELLDFLGKRIRRDPRPFGGLQVVFTGDFYQLPPVGNKVTEVGGEKGEGDGSGQFCFESENWYKAFPLDNHILLTTIFRQKDANYKAILNEVRIGKITPTNVSLLKSYVNRPFDKAAHNGCVPTKLFAIHRKVDAINQEMFDALDEESYEYNHIQKDNCVAYMENAKPIDYITLGRCKKELTPKKIEREMEYLITNCPCDRILHLKKGANVMCTVNLDMDNGICNGAIGVIQDFVPHAGVPMPIVLFSNGIQMQIPFKYWQSEEFPTLAIAQIPLRLAWAMTIHKIQGATLPMAEIDIGLSIFECGQTYVALSRVQSLEGLYLCGFDPSRIKVHPKVRDFYNTIPLVEYEEEDTVDASSASVQPDPNIKTVNLSFQQYAYMPV